MRLSIAPCPKNNLAVDYENIFSAYFEKCEVGWNKLYADYPELPKSVTILQFFLYFRSNIVIVYVNAICGVFGCGEGSGDVYVSKYKKGLFNMLDGAQVWMT